MNSLEIEVQWLDNDVFAEIASCVTNIKTLSIGHHRDTQTNIKGIHALAEGILKRNEPVSYSILKRKFFFYIQENM